MKYSKEKETVGSLLPLFSICEKEDCPIPNDGRDKSPLFGAFDPKIITTCDDLWIAVVDVLAD